MHYDVLIVQSLSYLCHIINQIVRIKPYAGGNLTRVPRCSYRLRPTLVIGIRILT